MAIHFKEEQVWTKEAGSGKSKRTFIVKAVTACDEIDTIITMVDFDSNNPVAAHAHVMNEDPHWQYHENASVVEEVVIKRKINFEGGEMPTIPQRKRKSKTKLVSIANKTTLKEEPKEEETKDKPPTWDRFKFYTHEDIRTLGTIFHESSTLADRNLKAGFKDNYFRMLHEQALDMWRDEGVTIKDIQMKQKVHQRDKETGQRVPVCRSLQTIVKRLFKAISHFGTEEEKQALFNPFGIKPLNQKN